MPFLGPVVADMVRLQVLTGMRSDSLCALRPCDIAQTGEVWVCRPKHKMEYRGTVLEVFLGPKAQAILKPYLERDPQAYCFSPRESEAKRFEAIRKRKKKATPRRGLRDRYDSVAYWHAIQHGLRKAKKANVEIPSWHPHQIRHAVSTLIRARYGIEAAKAFLGHGDVETALIYAEKDTEAAKRIAHEMG
jgi:integrase